MKRNKNEIPRRKGKSFVTEQTHTRHKATQNISTRSTKAVNRSETFQRSSIRKSPIAKLLNIKDSEIPFMFQCANKGIKAFVIVSGPSNKGIKNNAESLDVAKKLIIPLKDEVSNSPAMTGELVNKQINKYGFVQSKVVIVTRNIEGPLNKS